jgi:transcriptional regulator with XRE-family HTH domain
MSPLVPMTIQEQLARRILTKRKLLRLNQTELAQKVGTSQNAIARLENGLGTPTVNLIQRLATALDLPLTLYVRPHHPAEPPEPEWLNQP